MDSLDFLNNIGKAVKKVQEAKKFGGNLIESLRENVKATADLPTQLRATLTASNQANATEQALINRTAPGVVSSQRPQSTSPIAVTRTPGIVEAGFERLAKTDTSIPVLPEGTKVAEDLKARYGSIPRFDPFLSPTSVIGSIDDIGRNAKNLAGSIDDAANKAKQVLSSLGDTPKPLVSPGKVKPQQPHLPVIPDEEIGSLKTMVRNSDIDVKSKVNIIDYFKTPENVLKKMGLEKEAGLIRQGYDNYRKDLSNEIKYLQGLAAKAPGKEASKRIFQHLDGQDVSLTSTEMEVAQELKGYLGEWARKLGLPEDKRIANYITHIFEPDFIQKEFDPDLAKIIADKIPGSVYDPFLQKRLGAKGYVEDVWRAMDAYVKRGTRKFNMDPALTALKEAGRDLDLESFKYVKRYADKINMRPTEVDTLLDNLIKSTPIGYKFGQRPTTVLTQAWRRIIYRGTLGLNFGSALRNLTQGANTFAKLGTKYTTIGYRDLLRKSVSGLDELREVGILDDVFLQDQQFGVLKKTMERVDKGLFAVFQTAEKINRGAAYFGAKRKAIAMGMNPEQAVEYAKKIVRETQFAFSSIDTPVALGSDLAKTIAQLQTYNLKQAEFLTTMIKNKEYGGLIRWAGASLVAVYSVGQALGMKPQDLIPTFRLGGSPLGNLVTGAGKQLSPNERTRQEGQDQLKRTGVLLVPGGAQIKKSIEGATVVSEGRSRTPKGKTRFKVKKSLSNMLRATIFGTRSLPESRKYYDKKK